MNQAASTGPILGQGQAGGKLILLGEHFVVHGAPALALPLTVVRTEVTVYQQAAWGPARLTSPAQGAAAALAEELFALALERLGLRAADRPWQVLARSSVPIGAGLGSSAAFAVALLQALAQAAGLTLRLDDLRAHAHALEQRVHGDPSGIDDTTVASGRPVWFVRGAPPLLLERLPELCLVLASSGRPRATAQAVGQVGELKRSAPARFAALLAEAKLLAEAGRAALEQGSSSQLGPLLTRNHALLQELGVSCPELDRLVQAALDAGALGAKLTGAGCGGFVVALLAPELTDQVVAALGQAGAPLVLHGSKGER